MTTIHTKKTKIPAALRIETMWNAYREKIIEHFPKKQISVEAGAYLKQVDELYVQDAYNSLSIEGYQVTRQLLNRVRDGHWNPDENNLDASYHDALAARGYFEAFQKVKDSIEHILNGKPAGKIARDNLPIWFMNLFNPAVRAGLLQPTDLFGWRKQQVYIRGSRHTPLSYEYLPEVMDTFFACLENEENFFVRAVLGHFIFVYIHPYMDGNGRTARFLMNTQLASGGHPWIIVPVEKKQEYFAALESAGVGGDILPFATFINSLSSR